MTHNIYDFNFLWRCTTIHDLADCTMDFLVLFYNFPCVVFQIYRVKVYYSIYILYDFLELFVTFHAWCFRSVVWRCCDSVTPGWVWASREALSTNFPSSSPGSLRTRRPTSPVNSSSVMLYLKVGTTVCLSSSVSWLVFLCLASLNICLLVSVLACLPS